jgi:hypothetical protein
MTGRELILEASGYLLPYRLSVCGYCTCLYLADTDPFGDRQVREHWRDPPAPSTASALRKVAQGNRHRHHSHIAAIRVR